MTSSRKCLRAVARPKTISSQDEKAGASPERAAEERCCRGKKEYAGTVNIPHSHGRPDLTCHIKTSSRNICLRLCSFSDGASLASSVATLAELAVQASKSLYQIVESFKSSNRTVRELREEFKGRNQALEAHSDSCSRRRFPCRMACLRCFDRQSDLLRPNPKESSRIFLHSLNTWRSLLSVAQSTSGFPDFCFNIRNILHNTPAIPDSSRVMETAEGNRLLLHGYSLWKIDSVSDCELNSKLKRSESRAIVIGELQPIFCKLSDEFLWEWSGLDTTPGTPPTGNYLCVFVLGWAYIFSARLLELRREDNADKILYTDSRAILHAMDTPAPNHRFLIPVGDADEQELRWWEAILAKGCGWQATLTRAGKAYVSPWACHLDDDRPLTILYNKLESTSASLLEPPTSTQAQCYLLRLAKMHNAVDQLIAAFMATLTIPRQHRFGAPVRLPEPQLGTGLSRDIDPSYISNIPSFAEIPHYMALSCISGAISSSLFGSFWQSGVPCNLVSEWLYTPLQDILQPLINQNKWQVILQVMTARRPNLGPLWLGTLITGLLPTILRGCSSYFYPISLEATVWTRSPQSFMDPVFYQRPDVRRNLKLEEIITREDEFRLLYITDFNSEVYSTPPLCPYPPFGVTKLQDTALEVRLHVSCNHSLAYSHWVWHDEQGERSKSLVDYGLTRSPTIPRIQQPRRLTLFRRNANVLQQPLQRLSRFWTQLYISHRLALKSPLDERLSERATRNVFQWVFYSDGVKSEDKEMWHHKWLERFLNNGDEDTISDDNSSSTSFVQRQSPNISSWLESLPDDQ